MKKHIQKFLIGNISRKEEIPIDGLKEHFAKIKSVWEGDLYDDFGIERIFRLFLISAKLLFPGIYIQRILSGGIYIRRKLIGEFYVIVKTLLPFFILYYQQAQNPLFQVLNFYMLLETMIYILNKIYVSEHETETAHKRSLLLLFLNYIELVLAFAVIYSSADLMNVPFHSYLDAIYFSVVTSVTIGLGDVYPVKDFGKAVLISQALTSLSFLVLFFNFFGSRLRD